MSREFSLDAAIAITPIIVAALAIWVSWKALKRSDQGLYADLLLRLDQEMRNHRHVHTNLRPGGAWATPNGGPETQSEWIDVEDYMGIFEHINFFIDKNLITIDYVERFYGYRYDNIVANARICRAKLDHERDGWEDFLALGQKLATYRSRLLGNQTTLEHEKGRK
jgi:hypothetical protein